MQLVNIGFGNIVSAERIIAIVSPESAPIKRMVQEAKDAGTITKAEETMARNIQRNLASRVQEASALFRKKQSAYLKSEYRLQFVKFH